jgi:hypothetical protein
MLKIFFLNLTVLHSEKCNHRFPKHLFTDFFFYILVPHTTLIFMHIAHFIHAIHNILLKTTRKSHIRLITPYKFLRPKLNCYGKCKFTYKNDVKRLCQVIRFPRICCIYNSTHITVLYTTMLCFFRYIRFQEL